MCGEGKLCEGCKEWTETFKRGVPATARSRVHDRRETEEDSGDFGGYESIRTPIGWKDIDFWDPFSRHRKPTSEKSKGINCPRKGAREMRRNREFGQLTAYGSACY